MGAIDGRRFVAMLGGVALALGLVAYISITEFHKANRRRSEEQAKWPKERRMKGGVMVLVPAGVFLAGQGREPVNTPAFYIDRERVSQASVREYRAASGIAESAASSSAEEAKAFCAWAGKRLPFSVEWEKAAKLRLAEGQYGAGWEWIDDARKAGTEDAARFQLAHGMTPPLALGERWMRVRGGQPPADASMFPARYRSAEIGFRCVYLPPQ
jgi:formylglycine-generating enzyme required for sulfatase activity